MDEKIEKAFEVVNYMATLGNQRRLLTEEIHNSLLYHINGATFKLTPELITFVKLSVDLGHDTDAVFVDSNNLPVLIADVQKFFDDIVSQYFSIMRSYSNRYQAIKSKRKILDLTDL